MKIPPFFTALFASAMFTLSVSQGVLAANSTNGEKINKNITNGAIA